MRNKFKEKKRNEEKIRFAELNFKKEHGQGNKPSFKRKETVLTLTLHLECFYAPE